MLNPTRFFVILVALLCHVAFCQKAVGQKQALKPLTTISGPVHSVSFSPDGAHMLVGRADGTIDVVVRSTGKVLRQIDAHKGPVTSLKTGL